MSIVKCPVCGKTFNNKTIDNIHLGNRYYHTACCNEDMVYKHKIFEYLKRMWGKYTYVKINNQINSFVSKNGFTVKEIYNSLVYFFEVEGKDALEYPDTIGIVPFVHSKAKKYYDGIERKDKKKALVAIQLEEQINKTPIIIEVKNSKEKKKKDLFKIEEG